MNRGIQIRRSDSSIGRIGTELGIVCFSAQFNLNNPNT